MTITMSKIEKFIQEYKFDTNLIFDGNPGVWKTYIMKRLFDKLPKNDGTLVKYWIDDWEVREFITAWNFSLRNVQDNISVLEYPLEMCVRVKYLFFDDLGSSENVSDSQRTKLKYILDEREKKWLVTIYSTNISPKELSNLYWERIKSRIYNWKSKRWLQLINIGGPDRRKENIQTTNL